LESPSRKGFGFSFWQKFPGGKFREKAALVHFGSQVRKRVQAGRFGDLVELEPCGVPDQRGDLRDSGDARELTSQDLPAL
jgi:hypothetical protein